MKTSLMLLLRNSSQAPTGNENKKVERSLIELEVKKKTNEIKIKLCPPLVTQTTQEMKKKGRSDESREEKRRKKEGENCKIQTLLCLH